jgi:hypothetical protein
MYAQVPWCQYASKSAENENMSKQHVMPFTSSGVHLEQLHTEGEYIEKPFETRWSENSSRDGQSDSVADIEAVYNIVDSALL